MKELLRRNLAVNKDEGEEYCTIQMIYYKTPIIIKV